MKAKDILQKQIEQLQSRIADLKERKDILIQKRTDVQSDIDE